VEGVETRRIYRYRRFMPNRKTFDPNERYDHSSRPLEHAKKNDLKPDVVESGVDRVESGVDREGAEARRAGKTGDRARPGSRSDAER
jgi:hypothetical protein